MSVTRATDPTVVDVTGTYPVTIYVHDQKIVISLYKTGVAFRAFGNSDVLHQMSWREFTERMEATNDVCR
jgi:hypothetical protein